MRTRRPVRTARNEDAVDHNEQEQVALHRWPVIAEAGQQSQHPFPDLGIAGARPAST